jgi:hypothetical protein
MNYSKTQRRFSVEIDDVDVLVNPQSYFGPNYKTVLNFWTYLDSLTEEQIREVENRINILNLWNIGPDNIKNRCTESTLYAVDKSFENTSDKNVFIVGECFGDSDYEYAAAIGTCEIIAMDKIFQDQGKSLTFVPLFDFTGNYELQSLDVKEIETRIQRINDFIGPKVEVKNDVVMTEEDLKSFIEDVELFD